MLKPERSFFLCFRSRFSLHKYPPPRFARRREWELNTKHPSPGPCACPYPSPFAQFQWCLVCFRGSDNPPPGMAARWTHPPKKNPKSIKNRFFFESVFQCLFGSIFGPFCLPTCLLKSIEMCKKSMPRCIPSWTPCLDRFLVDFCSQLGSPEPNLALAG